MSKEEEQQVIENERMAKPIIESYIDEKFKGALVQDIKCLTETNDTLFTTIDVTDYVKAKILYNDINFDVVVDLATEEIHTDYYNQKIIDELEVLVVEETSVENPKDIEIEIDPRGFAYYVDGGWNYIREDIDSAEELLSEDGYRILILCKYINNQMKFESIPIKSFFKTNYKCNIQIAFVNYRDAVRYVYNELPDSDFTNFSVLFNDEQDYYNVSDIKSASQINEKKKQSDGKNITELVYEEDYKHYKKQAFNNIEFIWNDEYYDIELSEAIADDVVVTEHYNGDPFYAISKDAIKINCTKITDKELDYNSRIYMYYPRNLLDFQEDRYVITQSSEGAVASKLHWMMGDYYYEYWKLEDNRHEFTLGFYKRADSEEQQ